MTYSKKIRGHNYLYKSIRKGNRIITKYAGKEKKELWWKNDKVQLAFTWLEMGIGISLIIIGLVSFYVGFHNVDLSWNMLRVANSNNLDYYSWVDQYNAGGSTMNYDKAYIIGMDYMQWAWVFLFMGGMLLGGSMIKLENKFIRKELTNA